MVVTSCTSAKICVDLQRFSLSASALGLKLEAWSLKRRAQSVTFPATVDLPHWELLYNYDQLFGSRDAWRLLKRWSTLQVSLGRVTNTKTLHFTIWNQSTTPIFSIQISFVIQPERIFGIIIDFHRDFLNISAIEGRGKFWPDLSHSSKLFGTRDNSKISSLRRGPWRGTSSFKSRISARNFPIMHSASIVGPYANTKLIDFKCFKFNRR